MYIHNTIILYTRILCLKKINFIYNLQFLLELQSCFKYQGFNRNYLLILTKPTALISQLMVVSIDKYLRL